MWRTILTQLAQMAALIVGVILAGGLDLLEKSPLKSAVVIAAVLISIASAALEIWGAIRIRPKFYRGRRREEKIQRYMTRLLDLDGRCVVSSNDLSWAKGEACRALQTKATSNSLVLVMPNSNAFSRELSKLGAEVYYYGGRDFQFQSRFTLVNHGRADQWIAIGHGTSRGHTIREIQGQDDPTTHLAVDLIRLVKRHAVGRTTS